MGKHLALLVFVFYGSLLTGQGQKEGNNWFFGDHSAISFNSGAARPLAYGAIRTSEGVATISDSSGQLLFYTDGSNVYNSQDQVMPNGSGLLGNASATQSAVIVRAPGSSRLYYVITVDAFEHRGKNGLRYSIVDLSLHDGQGDVTVKNVLLRDVALEKLTIVRQANHHDFWILINDYNEDDIFAYSLSCQGISSIPVKSHVSPIHNHNMRQLAGYMKTSRQGDQLAMALTYDQRYLLFDFDNKTGIASHKKTIQSTDSTLGTPYGVEFSPDGLLLYVTSLWSPMLLQLNLKAGSGNDIYKTRRVLGTHSSANTLNSFYYGALQLGPDGRIYCANNGDQHLGVIQHPNIAGTGCGFIPYAVDLGGRTCYLGLPNLLSDYVLPLPVDTVRASVCSGYDYSLPDGRKVRDAGVYISHLSIGAVCDSEIVTRLTVREPTSSVVRETIYDGNNYDGYTQTGLYTDVFTGSNGCDSVRTLYLTVKPKAISVSIDTIICAGLRLDGYSATGIYVDSFTSMDGRDSIRTLHLTVLSPPEPKLDGGIVCFDDSVVLYPGDYDRYLWQDGSTGSHYTVREGGFYSVEVGNRCGVARAEVRLVGQSCRLVFPAAFTPNADGRNDLFRPLHAEGLKSYHFSVYDRWGARVYASDNSSLGWDGRVGGQAAPPGVYVWNCQFSNAGRGATVQTGTVILIR